MNGTGPDAQVPNIFRLLRLCKRACGLAQRHGSMEGCPRYQLSHDRAPGPHDLQCRCAEFQLIGRVQATGHDLVQQCGRQSRDRSPISWEHAAWLTQKPPTYL